MLGGQSLLQNGLSDGDDDDKEDDDDFINDDGDDDDDEVHDPEDNNRGTDDDLDSNDAVDEEGEQPIRRQNARVRKQETRVLSIAQDLVYSVSGDQRWTPKHVGLGSSLHQATRSKKLVSQCRSYNQLLGCPSSRYCPCQAHAFNNEHRNRNSDPCQSS